MEGRKVSDGRDSQMGKNEMRQCLNGVCSIDSSFLENLRQHKTTKQSASNSQDPAVAFRP